MRLLLPCMLLLGAVLATPAQAQRQQVSPDVQLAPVGEVPRGSDQASEPTPSGGQVARARRCEEVQREARFALPFDAVDIEELVQLASNATCKTFILPEGLRGKVSIVGPRHGRSDLSAEELYAAFLAALDANGLAVQPSGRFLKIVPKASARRGPLPVVIDPEPR